MEIGVTTCGFASTDRGATVPVAIVAIARDTMTRHSTRFINDLASGIARTSSRVESSEDMQSEIRDEMSIDEAIDDMRTCRWNRCVHKLNP